MRTRPTHENSDCCPRASSAPGWHSLPLKGSNPSLKIWEKLPYTIWLETHPHTPWHFGRWETPRSPRWNPFLMDTWRSSPLSFPGLSLSLCCDPHHIDINASSSLVVKWISAHLMLQTGSRTSALPSSSQLPSWWFLIPCLPAGCSPPIFRPSCLTAPGSFPSWMSFTPCQLHLPETHQQHYSGIPHVFLLVFWTAWPGLEESL